MFKTIAYLISRYMAKIREHGLNAILTMLGPVAVAGAHFWISLLLIAHMSAADFGIFAFAMVMMQLGTGFSDGLLGSPMAVSQGNTEKRPYLVFAFINWIYSIAYASITFVALWFFSDSLTAFAFSLYIMIMIFRWFGRAYLLTNGNRKFVNRSDVFYSIFLVAVSGLVHLNDQIDLKIVVMIMLIAAVISTPLLGRAFFAVQLKARHWRLLKDFIPIWKSRAKWSIIAVMANAMTIESHVFIVTLMRGPEGFAPIAVAALFFRPTLIGIYALAQIERPKISGCAVKYGTGSAKDATRLFIAITTTLWAVNAVVAAMISIWALHLVLSASYDTSVVQFCVLTLAAVMLVRSIRQPVLTFLQATNQFQSVANITLYIAPFSLLFAAVGLWIAGAAGSILGLLIADVALLCAMLTGYAKTMDMGDLLGRHVK